MDSPSWVMYVSISVLILMSAFFSASETSVSTFNRIRLKKQAQAGNRQAQKTLNLSERYDKALTTILIGNNLVNITASTIATMIATALFGASGAIISTIVMTFLVLIFGEILPKSYSMQHADAVALRLSGLLSLFMWLLTPLSFFFTKLSTAFGRAGDGDDPQPSVTEEELMYIIESIEEEGVLEEQERDLVQSALEFDETTIRQVITPRVNVTAINVDDTPDEIMEVILEEGYSRIPVYESTIDNIIGILYTKEYLRGYVRKEPIDLRAMLHAPYFVHKGMRLPHLLTNLKNRKLHLAVVLDEYGGTYGIVTMEDLLEELVGDIWDEDDEIPNGLTALADGIYEVSGSYDVVEMLEELECEAIETYKHTTVSGWAMHLLEHIPEPGETFVCENLECVVLEMDHNRIKRLGIQLIEPGEDGEEQQDNA